MAYKSPIDLADSILSSPSSWSDEEISKYLKDANVNVSQDALSGSTYLDQQGNFIHNRTSHGEAEDRVVQKYKETEPEKMKRLNQWITNNTITLNSKPLEKYILLTSEPNAKQYEQLIKWLDKHYGSLGSIEVNFQDTPFGKHLGRKSYHSKDNSVDDIIKEIKRFYQSGKLSEF